MSDSRFRTPGSLLRFVCVVACLLLAVTGCSHPLPDYVSRYTTPPPEPPLAAVAVIGDPHTSGASTGTLAWPALVAAQLRRQNINVDVQIVADAKQVIRPTTKVVVVFGAPGETAASDAQHAMAQAKKTAPQAKLLVIGPTWTNGPPPKNLQAVRQALKAEAKAAGATFVDPVADGWFANQPELVGPDHVTLTDAGHAYLAGKIAPLIAQQLQPLPATPR